jgi:hypothetical protein
LKVKANVPPREFRPSPGSMTKILDCGKIVLEEDEMVTFLAEGDLEYDVTRKNWGFYATPSINGRLKKFGWKTALVRGVDRKYYVFLVDALRRHEFSEYIEKEQHQIIEWLDEKE